jgi:hypothetical protein
MAEHHRKEDVSCTIIPMRQESTVSTAVGDQLFRAVEPRRNSRRLPEWATHAQSHGRFMAAIRNLPAERETVGEGAIGP